MGFREEKANFPLPEVQAEYAIVFCIDIDPLLIYPDSRT